MIRLYIYQKWLKLQKNGSDGVGRGPASPYMGKVDCKIEKNIKLDDTINKLKLKSYN